MLRRSAKRYVYLTIIGNVVTLRCTIIVRQGNGSGCRYKGGRLRTVTRGVVGGDGDVVLILYRLTTGIQCSNIYPALYRPAYTIVSGNGRRPV